MVQNVNYWYNGQIRHLILCAIRLFSNFYISDGKDENGNDILRRIPCNFISTDKEAAAELSKNTDTYVQSAPRMILTISNLDMNNDKSSGSPYYEYESEICEKKFDEESNNYINEPGNRYHITRLNPIPLGITFKLFILTTMVSQKLQLFEQIRTLFTPTLELQTSENPLDWNRINAITMTNINWTSRGDMNIDSTTFDTMDFTFQVDTHLDLPAMVEHSQLIENIITNVSLGSSLEDLEGWKLNTIEQRVYTPTNSTITVENNGEITLLPNEKCKNWYQLLKTFDISYNPNKSNIQLQCNTNDDLRNPYFVSGKLVIDTSNPIKAHWIINQSLLPKTNLPNIDKIIDPTDYQPYNTNGERYLIVENLYSNTIEWGQIYNKQGQLEELAYANSIIEYKDNHWTIMTDPNEEPAEYFISDNDDITFIYTYNYEYDVWVDYINRKYRPGFWKIIDN